MLYFEIYKQTVPMSSALYYQWALMDDTQERESCPKASSIEGDFMDTMIKVGDEYLKGNWKKHPPVFCRSTMKLSSTQKQVEENELEHVKLMLRGA